MRTIFRSTLKKALHLAGYSVSKNTMVDPYPDFTVEDHQLISKVQPFTLTNPERVIALRAAIEYIVANRIDGDIVECGVWRGGSVMAALYELLRVGDTTRSIYLFDTFEGMTAPTNEDVDFSGQRAVEALSQVERKPGSTIWAWATLEDAKHNVLSVGYPAEKIHFIKGDVLETIPELSPEKIVLLRLDTDWYESTKHELIHLYPKVVEQGVLIIDDYGHFKGARKAVDEYFSLQPYRPLLHRIDYTGRCVVKV